MPANGRKMDMQWVSTYRIVDGKVAEHWSVNDVYAMAVQLGAVSLPPMG